MSNNSNQKSKDFGEDIIAKTIAGLMVVFIFFGIKFCALHTCSSDSKSKSTSSSYGSFSPSECYSYGYKYGRCATMSLKGKSCNPSDDIVIPESCREKPETQAGINDGVKSVMQ